MDIDNSVEALIKPTTNGHDADVTIIEQEIEFNKETSFTLNHLSPAEYSNDDDDGNTVTKWNDTECSNYYDFDADTLVESQLPEHTMITFGPLEMNNSDIGNVSTLKRTDQMSTFSPVYNANCEPVNKVLSTFTNGTNDILDIEDESSAFNSDYHSSHYTSNHDKYQDSLKTPDNMHNGRTMSTFNTASFDSNYSVPNSTMANNSYQFTSNCDIHDDCSDIEVPVIVLTSNANSCSFIKRKILLNKPVKVGRAIARTRQAMDNAIFDCKVLSRNHALIWYKDGKFFLKDTGSSNGTFVNNVRLSSANEKSEPHELFSGDCVQFGVEVTEKKNIHSCVIANITLYGPDGVELAKNSHSSENGGDDLKSSLSKFRSYLSSNINITPIQLIELSCFIKDAMYKQALLENQLETMKNVMNSALESAKTGWNSLVEEDRLLSRIETLQAKMEVLLLSKSKDAPVDAVVETMRQEMLLMISDKEKFDQVSKTSLQNALEDKMVAYTKLETVQEELKLKNEECNKLTIMVNQNVAEMKNLINNFEKVKIERDDLLESYKNCEDEQKALCLRFDDERSKLQDKLLNTELSEKDAKMKYDELKELFVKPVSLNASCQTMLVEQLNCLAQQDSNLSTDSSQNLSNVKIEASQVSASFVNEKLNHNKDSNNCDQSVEMSKIYETNLLPSNNEFCSLHLNLAQTFEQIETNYKLIVQNLCKKDDVMKDVVRKLHTLQRNIILSQQLFKRKLSDSSQQLDLQTKINKTLTDSINEYRVTIDKQYDEIEKFKCDIENLNCQIQKTFHLNKINSEKKAPLLEHKSLQTDSSHMGATTQSSKSLLQIMKFLKKFDTVDLDTGSSNANDVNNCNHFENNICIGDNILEKLESISLKYNKEKELNDKLNKELIGLNEKYTWLSYKNEVSFSMAFLPLFAIFIAIILAFYPLLSYLMATTEY